MVKEVVVRNAGLALVDDEDYPLVSRYSWRASNKKGYAMTTFKANEESEFTVYMHKLVMGMGCFGVCDHINGNVLDNRKENLRHSSYQQNGWNSVKQKTSAGKPTTSKYKGVYRVESKTLGTRWFAYIKDSERTSKKIIRIGYFGSEDDAARAYNAKALELRGEHAKLNPVPQQG